MSTWFQRLRKGLPPPDQCWGSMSTLPSALHHQLCPQWLLHPPRNHPPTSTLSQRSLLIRTLRSPRESIGVHSDWGAWLREACSPTPPITPSPVFLPGEFCGQRCLAGYSLKGLKKSDKTECLTLCMIHPSPMDADWCGRRKRTVPRLRALSCCLLSEA